MTLKLATSLDGRIATRTGASQWITGPLARRFGHMLRATHDAILAGIGTILADDPRLTCRLPGYEARPAVRIALDSALRTPPDSVLVRTATRDAPVWFLHAPDVPVAARTGLSARPGVRLFVVARTATGLDIPAALRCLAAAGLTRLLVEGGGQVAASFLRADRVDTLAWILTDGVIGGDGLPAVAGYGVETLADMARFEAIDERCLGVDRAILFRRLATAPSFQPGAGATTGPEG